MALMTVYDMCYSAHTYKVDQNSAWLLSPFMILPGYSIIIIY